MLRQVGVLVGGIGDFETGLGTEHQLLGPKTPGNANLHPVILRIEAERDGAAVAEESDDFRILDDLGLLHGNFPSVAALCGGLDSTYNIA